MYLLISEHDAFTHHFANPDEDEIHQRIQALKDDRMVTEKPSASLSWLVTFRRPLTSPSLAKSECESTTAIRDFKVCSITLDSR